jgi:hypothetical protein
MREVDVCGARDEGYRPYPEAKGIRQMIILLYKNFDQTLK